MESLHSLHAASSSASILSQKHIKMHQEGKYLLVIFQILPISVQITEMPICIGLVLSQFSKI